MEQERLMAVVESAQATNCNGASMTPGAALEALRGLW